MLTNQVTLGLPAKMEKIIYLLSYFDRGGWAYSDRFLHIFVSTGHPISHEIIQKCPFMQTALALQNHAKSFFPARTQSAEISNFGNSFAISE